MLWRFTVRSRLNCNALGPTWANSMGELSFFLQGHPPLPNRSQYLHWARKSRETKVWRTAAFYAARSAFRDSTLDGQALHPVRIDVRFFYKVRRTRDRANMVASLKPVIDGLVDARIMPDDGPEWLPDPPFVEEVVGHGDTGIEVKVTEI
jgi:crossover junction endodeoxyribonuclease RusA